MSSRDWVVTHDAAASELRKRSFRDYFALDGDGPRLRWVTVGQHGVYVCLRCTSHTCAHALHVKAWAKAHAALWQRDDLPHAPANGLPESSGRVRAKPERQLEHADPSGAEQALSVDATRL